MHIESSRAPATALVAAAFAAVYVIWGSTYLAIRVAVETMPPYLMAGVRHLIAGLVLYPIVRRGATAPTRAQWRAGWIIGGLLLLGGNGSVVWAEQTVPSGVAAVLVATLPLWIVVLSYLRRDSEWPSVWEVVGIIVGFGGVFILIDPFAGGAVERVDRAGAAALVLASLSWAFGSLYARRAPTPSSPLLGTAMQMICGGVLLVAVGLIRREWRALDLTAVSVQSMAAFVYLIVFGSLIGFTAYMWLLRVSTPAKVSTYAYVNPAVAVVLGWLVLGERLSPRTLLATAIIVASVVVITKRGRKVKTLKKACDSSAQPPLSSSHIDRQIAAKPETAAAEV